MSCLKAELCPNRTVVRHASGSPIVAVLVHQSTPHHAKAASECRRVCILRNPYVVIATASLQVSYADVCGHISSKDMDVSLVYQSIEVYRGACRKQ